MALTLEEKQEVRRYLGYLGVTTAGSIHLGIPAASQPLFVVEDAMNRILPEAETMVREYLEELRCIDSQLKAARKRRTKVSRAGSVYLRGQDEIDTLHSEYDSWSARLSDILGAPINPYSELHRRINGTLSVTVPR